MRTSVILRHRTRLLPVDCSRWYAVAMLAIAAGCEDPVQPRPPVAASVTVTASASQLSSLGDTVRFTAVVKDSSGATIDGAPVQWSSDQPATMRVDGGTGVAVALGNGTATIRAISGGATGQATVTITQVAVSIEAVPGALSFAALNDTVRLQAILRDAGGAEVVGAEVRWESRNSTVATVQTFGGLARSVVNGQTQIVASSGALSDTVAVTVAQVVVGFTMLPLGQAVPGMLITPRVGLVDALGNFVEGTSVSYELFTLDNSIATATGDQRIRALRAGTVLVRARSGSLFADQRLVIRETLGGVLTTFLELTEPVTLHVTSELHIAGSGRLVLVPGTTLLFDGPFGITVDGVLIARGTASDSVRFLSSRASPTAGDWAGIRIVNGATVLDSQGNYVSGSVISHAVITHGGGVWVDGGRAAILDSRIQHNKPVRSNAPHGAVAVAGSNVTVRGNHVLDNEATGVRVYGGSARIQRNRIAGNLGRYLGTWHGGGLTIRAATVVIEDNRIAGNTSEYMGGGIMLDESTSATIRYNDILDNVLTGPPNAGSAIGKNFFGVNATVEFNNIEGNRCTATGDCAAIFFTAGFQGAIRNNNIVNPGAFEVLLHVGATGGTISAGQNYWGTSSSSAIEARIWDRADNPNLSVVNYTPPMQDRIAGTGARP